MILPYELKNKILLYLSCIPFDKNELLNKFDSNKVNNFIYYDNSLINSQLFICRIFLSNMEKRVSTAINETIDSYNITIFKIFIDQPYKSYESKNKIYKFINPLFNNYNTIKSIMNILNLYNITDKKFVYYEYVKNSCRSYNNMNRNDMKLLSFYCIYKLY
jgi:hypothetical protein